LTLRAISRICPEDGNRIFLRDVGINFPNRCLLSEIMYAVLISAMLASCLHFFLLHLMNDMSDVSENMLGGNGHCQVVFVWRSE
jgi:hypothetical protein